MTSLALQICQTALNAFPLFEVLLRIKKPSRLPSGVYFDLDQSGYPSLRIRVSLTSYTTSTAAVR